MFYVKLGSLIYIKNTNLVPSQHYSMGKKS